MQKGVIRNHECYEGKEYGAMQSKNLTKSRENG